MILGPESRTTENVTATENAVSAVGKITQAFGSSTPGFDLNGALSHWVQALPILHDDEEANFSYRYLLSLMESNHPAILGENNANFPKLASILAQAVSSDLELESDLEAHMINSLKAILQVAPVELPTLLVDAAYRLPVLQKKLGM
ncbi:hypothetical protein HDV05_007447 [Chytridiales sp. JEL 0842]|nr:hypothetical protein HDV05_007447 [Chytridiales sp. JEL 0842]